MALSLEQIKTNASARAAEKSKAEAAEKASKEKEAKKGELSGKLESAQSKMADAEKNAADASAELAGLSELESQVADDPESLAEIKSARAEHQQTIADFEAVKQEFEAIKSEIAAFESGEPTAVDAEEAPKEVEKPAETITEASGKVEIQAEAPAAESTETAVEGIEGSELDSLSPDEATDFMKSTFAKVMTDSDLTPEKLKSLGNAYLAKMEKVTDPKKAMNPKGLENFNAHLKRAITMAKDKQMARTPGVSEEEVLKQASPETFQWKLDEVSESLTGALNRIPDDGEPLAGIASPKMMERYEYGGSILESALSETKDFISALELSSKLRKRDDPSVAELNKTIENAKSKYDAYQQHLDIFNAKLKKARQQYPKSEKPNQHV